MNVEMRVRGFALAEGVALTATTRAGVPGGSWRGESLDPATARSKSPNKPLTPHSTNSDNS